MGKLGRYVGTAVVALLSAVPGATYQPGTLEDWGLTSDVPESADRVSDRPHSGEASARRSDQGRRMRDRDYVLCLIVFPAVIFAIGVVVFLTDARLNHLLWASVALSIASGAWAWRVSSAAAGCVVAVGTFVFGWLSLGFALVVVWAALGGG
jgi:hypothetical protein